MASPTISAAPVWARPSPKADTPTYSSTVLRLRLSMASRSVRTPVTTRTMAPARVTCQEEKPSIRQMITTANTP